jgi:ribosomal-protein-alanine N-acetyltransferase
MRDTYKQFDTERLIIRPTSVEDAELVYELMNSPKFIQYVGDRKISSPEVAKTYIEEKMLPQLKELGYSSYTIIRKSDKNKIGTCGLYNRDGVDGIDIGFGLLPAYEGLGYAYESASRLKIAAFEEFDIKALKAITSIDNLASQRLLEKLGLAKAGITQLPGEKEALLLYQVNRH